MARRKTLTDNMVLKLKPGAKRLTKPDPELRGHYVRVTPTGAKSYVAVAREPYEKKQVWATIGSTDVYTIDEARDEAREAIKRIKAGLSAFEPPPVPPDSFKAVAENYIERHVKTKGLRSQAELERILDRHIYPVWQDRELESIEPVLDAPDGGACSLACFVNGQQVGAADRRPYLFLLVWLAGNGDIRLGAGWRDADVMAAKLGVRKRQALRPRFQLGDHVVGEGLAAGHLHLLGKRLANNSVGERHLTLDNVRQRISQLCDDFKENVGPC